MERKKIVHALDTPYTAVEWPQISQDDQDTILELLCHLLTPIGAHRKAFIAPSKGKRKRTHQAADQDTSTPTPPTPELAAHVDVGLSQISRTLQAMSAAESKPSQGPDQAAAASEPETAESSSGADAKNPYSIVFVARSGQSSAFHSHFPQMVALAGRSQPADNAVRLVGFSKACEERLSAALGIPRVSSVALREGAPQAKGLVDFVREHVAPVEVLWLREAQSATFLETKIAAVPTKIGVKKARLA